MQVSFCQEHHTRVTQVRCQALAGPGACHILPLPLVSLLLLLLFFLLAFNSLLLLLFFPFQHNTTCSSSPQSTITRTSFASRVSLSFDVTALCSLYFALVPSFSLHRQVAALWLVRDSCDKSIIPGHYTDQPSRSSSYSIYCILGLLYRLSWTLAPCRLRVHVDEFTT